MTTMTKTGMNDDDAPEFLVLCQTTTSNTKNWEREDRRRRRRSFSRLNFHYARIQGATTTSFFGNGFGSCLSLCIVSEK
jgi:hypothetical protein